MAIPLYIMMIAFFLMTYGFHVLYHKHKIPEKFWGVLLTAEKVCAEFSLQLLIFSVTHLLIKEYTNFDIYFYLTSLPLFPVIFAGYAIFYFSAKFRIATRRKNLRYISNIKHTEKIPRKNLLMLLTDTTAYLKIQQEKIGVLKSLSPIPVVLLVLNNFSSISFTYNNVWDILSKDKINIISLLILAIYSYWVITTFFRIKECFLLISEIENELHSLEFADSSVPDEFISEK